MGGSRKNVSGNPVFFKKIQDSQKLFLKKGYNK